MKVQLGSKTMNIKDLHQTDKGVATHTVFKTDHSSAVAIQLLKGEQLIRKTYYAKN